jgi:UDP-N-acetylmuramoyl-tripeptide--D-alanyl-D-alanine ligase
MSIPEIYKKFTESYLVSTDTRKIDKGSMFFALKGEQFDANAFADEAIEKGASYVVIDNPEYARDSTQYILVKDVLSTLQALASYHRNQLGLPIIALTGSNGKTTTKELINVVLSQKYITYATQGNLNNHIGVPLTLLAMNTSTEIGIVEMGANHFGEIARLCEIAQPDYGYITNFGKAHLEGFGSLEGVVKAKSELYDYLKKDDKKVFVNQEDSKQLELTADMRTIPVFSLKQSKVQNEFLNFEYEGKAVNTHLIGAYNLSNIATAIAIGKYFEVPETDIIKGIAQYKPDNKRSQYIEKGDVKIILDAYNANPTSMMVALNNFTQKDCSNKIPILGDMFELGSESKNEHQKIVDFVENQGFHKVILIGKNFAQTDVELATVYPDFEVFAQHFDENQFKNKELLIKASRGMALERVVTLFD